MYALTLLFHLIQSGSNDSFIEHLICFYEIPNHLDQIVNNN